MKTTFLTFFCVIVILSLLESKVLDILDSYITKEKGKKDDHSGN